MDNYFQGGFQLYMEALDEDFNAPDPIGDIFINLDLEANSGLTPRRTYTDDGISLVMTFRVDCKSDYYGPACTTFCQARDDDTNGHFTCDPDDGSRVCLSNYYGPGCLTFCQPSETYTCDQSDGSRICNEGFTNPETFCSESECFDLFILQTLSTHQY